MWYLPSLRAKKSWIGHLDRTRGTGFLRKIIYVRTTQLLEILCYMRNYSNSIPLTLRIMYFLHIQLYNSLRLSELRKALPKNFCLTGTSRRELLISSPLSFYLMKIKTREYLIMLDSWENLWKTFQHVNQWLKKFDNFLIHPFLRAYTSKISSLQENNYSMSKYVLAI